MKVRAGLVGYGLAGRVFHAPLMTAAGIELAAVVTSRRDEVKRDFPDSRVAANLSELLLDSDINLVVIASPNETHFGYAKAALQAERHVVIDKPFALNTPEASELIALAHTMDVHLSVFHNRRWDSDFLTLKDCIARDSLGKVVSYQCRFDRYRPQVNRRWREQPGAGAGLFFDLGPHLIDQALQIFGWPDWLSADISIQRPNGKVDDSFHLLMGVREARVLLGAGSLVADARPKFVVHGTLGSFVKSGEDIQESQLASGLRPGQAGFALEPLEFQAEVTQMTDGIARRASLPTMPGSYVTFYELMRQSVESDSSVPVLPSQAWDVIRLIELARHSSDAGVRVNCLAGR